MNYSLWAMLHNLPGNTCFYLLDHLASIGTKSDRKGEIVVGGIITYIARKFGVGEDKRLNRIEGNNRLNIETIIHMKFIKPHPPTNITFELQLNVPLCLIIPPNPSRTNTEVEDNLLCIGDNPQVHEEHNDIEEEGANLHHDYDASEKYSENNNRWAWMLTKVERISTEQQRQGVEISGLRNDVQRGDRVNDENNQMLRMLMQHFNLQGPPYGPQ